MATVTELASSITLGQGWADVDLGSHHAFYLAGIKESKGASDTIDPADIKRLSFEVGVDMELDEPLSVGYLTLNFEERTSTNEDINKVTALLRADGYPSTFKIRPTQIYTQNQMFTEGVTTVSVNIKPVSLR